MTLRFSSDNEALQHLADLTGRRVVIAEKVKKEGESTFKTKLTDEQGVPGATLTVSYEWTAEGSRFDSFKLTDLYVFSVKRAGGLKSIMRENVETGEREKSFYRKLEPVSAHLSREENERLDFEARKHFYDVIAPKLQEDENM
jgi:hypothetical protein